MVAGGAGGSYTISNNHGGLSPTGTTRSYDGTQTSTGSGTYPGGFGYGGSPAVTGDDYGPGGGGWYGGSSNGDTAGGGGSNYVSGSPLCNSVDTSGAHLGLGSISNTGFSFTNIEMQPGGSTLTQNTIA